MAPMPGLRVLDYVLLLTSAAVIGASVLWSSSGRQGELRAEIEASGEVYIMPLSRDGQLDLTGPAGNTRVVVSQGEAYVSDSDCRDKICVSMGHISRPSGWVACLPNRVFVRIVAVDPEKYAGEEVDSGAF